MLAQGQYDEFASEILLLAAPLRAALPQAACIPYNIGGHGRPGIFVFGSRSQDARYLFPVTLLILWRDPAILDYLESNASGRDALRGTFAGRVREILERIETEHGVDWKGGSQDSAQGLVIELEEF